MLYPHKAHALFLVCEYWFDRHETGMHLAYFATRGEELKIETVIDYYCYQPGLCTVYSVNSLNHVYISWLCGEKGWKGKE